MRLVGRLLLLGRSRPLQEFPQPVSHQEYWLSLEAMSLICFSTNVQNYISAHLYVSRFVAQMYQFLCKAKNRYPSVDNSLFKKTHEAWMFLPGQELPHPSLYARANSLSTEQSRSCSACRHPSQVCSFSSCCWSHSVSFCAPRARSS